MSEPPTSASTAPPHEPLVMSRVRPYRASAPPPIADAQRSVSPTLILLPKRPGTPAVCSPPPAPALPVIWASSNAACNDSAISLSSDDSIVLCERESHECLTKPVRNRPFVLKFGEMLKGKRGELVHADAIF